MLYHEKKMERRLVRVNDNCWKGYDTLMSRNSQEAQDYGTYDYDTVTGTGDGGSLIKQCEEISFISISNISLACGIICDG